MNFTCNTTLSDIVSWHINGSSVQADGFAALNLTAPMEVFRNSAGNDILELVFVLKVPATLARDGLTVQCFGISTSMMGVAPSSVSTLQVQGLLDSFLILQSSYTSGKWIQYCTRYDVEWAYSTNIHDGRQFEHWSICHRAPA